MHESSLWRNRNYLRLWAAAAVSGLGSQLSLIAYSLLVLSLGGTASQVGVVASCSLLTRMVCQLPGGHLADRFDGRKLMLSADLVRLVAVGSIPLAAAFGGASVAQLAPVAAIEGIATAVFGPAARIAVRDVVPAGQLTVAFARSQARAAVIDMIGPALGGALFGLGHEIPFTCDAASYALSALILLGLPSRPKTRTASGDGGGISAGLRWLWSRPAVRRVLIFASVVNLAAATAEILAVIALRDRGTPSATVGLVMACAGIGAVIGSMLAVRILRMLSGGWLYLSIGLVWAAALSVFAADSAAPVIAPLLVMMMLLAPAGGIRLAQITVAAAPVAILGRVSTAENTISAGLGAIGPLLAGFTVQSLGVSAVWAILAVLCGGASLFAATPRGATVSPVLPEESEGSAFSADNLPASP